MKHNEVTHDKTNIENKCYLVLFLTFLNYKKVCDTNDILAAGLLHWVYIYSTCVGRDGNKSHCILYNSYTDVFRQSTMVFTEQTGLEKLYGMVEYAYSSTK